MTAAPFSWHVFRVHHRMPLLDAPSRAAIQVIDVEWRNGTGVGRVGAAHKFRSEFWKKWAEAKLLGERALEWV
jgi:hypothetical protein